MSDFTDYTENQIANWLVGGSDMPVAHGNVYVALHTSNPSDSGENNEVSSSSYDRVQTAAGTDWNISGGEFENAVDVKFPSAQENWGAITHFTLWDGSTSSDNCLAVSPLVQTRDVNTGDTAVFRSGNLNGSVL